MAVHTTISSGDSFKKNGIAIHFIWMGGNIPAEYLRNIKECAAKALSDTERGYRYTVNLWVDNVNNYWNTAIKEDNIIHGKRFKVRHLSELNSTIKENYDTPTALKIICYTRRELVGFKNFAAASDTLRYIALQSQEGFYFDDDLSFSVALDQFDQYRDAAKETVDRKSHWEKEKLWIKGNRCESTLFNVDFPFYNLSMAALSAYPSTRCPCRNCCASGTCPSSSSSSSSSRPGSRTRRSERTFLTPSALPKQPKLRPRAPPRRTPHKSLCA